MPSYWVFVVKDHRLDDKIIPAREVLADRVRNRFWSLSSRAANVNKLEKDDRVLFYSASRVKKGVWGKRSLGREASSNNC